MGKLDIFWQKKNQHSAKYLLYFVNGHSFELSKIELQEDVRNSWYIWSEFLVEKQMILIKKINLRLIVYKTQGCRGPYALLRPLPPSCNYNPLCWLYGGPLYSNLTITCTTYTSNFNNYSFMMHTVKSRVLTRPVL